VLQAPNDSSDGDLLIFGDEYFHANTTLLPSTAVLVLLGEYSKSPTENYIQGSIFD